MALSVVAAGTVSSLVALAEPPSGMSNPAPQIIARGSYPPFKVDSDKHAFPLDFRAHAKQPLDIVVRQHNYDVDAKTGWHSHPGPAFITVMEGELTFYDYDDPSCTPTIVKAGEGYADSGHGHIGINSGETPAVDITVIIAPADPGLSFRTNLPAPNAYCGF